MSTSVTIGRLRVKNKEVKKKYSFFYCRTQYNKHTYTVSNVLIWHRLDIFIASFEFFFLLLYGPCQMNDRNMKKKKIQSIVRVNIERTSW